MRLWSIHPKYLDAKGLVALWREALLAKIVLQGKTGYYRNHPQLDRFKKAKNPVRAINLYLMTIYDEACMRGYCFDKKKIVKAEHPRIAVTSGQIEYEFKHVKAKLRKRDPKRAKEISNVKRIELNPLFRKVKGRVEYWEKK
ncbi:hypothetical protein GF345_01500 [Candidatus Woesearchaeota archaeon]|nr:hypothetical protein [Candidatus Woesearchaeota archaeon]